MALCAVALMLAPSAAFVAPALRTSTPRSAVKMQYAPQQQGYGQQGFGQQQQVLWTIYPAAGVQGHNKFSGAVSQVNQGRFGSVCEKYGIMPYALIANEDRILSKWNMVFPVDTVSRSQAKITVYPDGNALLTSNGSCAPTLMRQQGGQWEYLYEGQMQWLTNGCQVSLDASNPEGAVFTCQQEMGQQQGGFGQQQGGYY